MNPEGWGAAGVGVRFGTRQALDRVSISALPGRVTAVVATLATLRFRAFLAPGTGR